MKATNFVALLGAILVTAAELLALDYGTDRLVARSPTAAYAVLLSQE